MKRSSLTLFVLLAVLGLVLCCCTATVVYAILQVALSV